VSLSLLFLGHLAVLLVAQSGLKLEDYLLPRRRRIAYLLKNLFAASAYVNGSCRLPIIRLTEFLV